MQSNKLTPYSFMTARDLEANLARNWLIIGKRYDVTCVKMSKKWTQISCFVQVCAVQGKSNSFPISSEQPNIYFALKRFSIEAIHTRILWKIWRIWRNFTEGNSRNCIKKKKNTKKPYILNSLHGNDISSEGK